MSMENYTQDQSPSVPPCPPVEKGWIDSLWLPLRVLIYVIILVVMIPVSIIGWIITMPIERIIFYCSGWSKLQRNYYWFITRTTAYKVFRHYKKNFYAFVPSFFCHDLFVFEKHGVLIFVLCDVDSLVQWEEQNDWFQHSGGHGGSLRSFAVFYAMQRYADKNYPEKDKQFYVCLSKSQVKQGLHKIDNRLISISDLGDLL